MEEDTEGIDTDRVIEGAAVEAGLICRGGKSGQESHDRNHSQRLFRALLWHERIDDHDSDAEDAQHNLRQNADVVDGRNHRPATSAAFGRTLAASGGRGICVEWMTTGVGASFAPENCLSAALTAGS